MLIVHQFEWGERVDEIAGGDEWESERKRVSEKWGFDKSKKIRFGRDYLHDANKLDICVYLLYLWCVVAVYVTFADFPLIYIRRRFLHWKQFRLKWSKANGNNIFQQWFHGYFLTWHRRLIKYNFPNGDAIHLKWHTLTIFKIKHILFSAKDWKKKSQNKKIILIM